MKNNVVVMDKDWWKEERKPSGGLIIKKKRRLSDRYYTLNEASELLRCGYDVLYKAIRRGELEADAVGRSWRVTAQAIEEYLERCRIKKRVG